MRRPLPLAIVHALLAAAMPLMAADVAIHVNRHGDGSSSPKGTVTAQSVVDSGKSLVFPLPAPAVSLPSGDWFISAQIEGEWSEPRLISIHDAHQTVELNTFPLARLTARVTLATGKDPRELQAYFHRVSMEDIATPAEGSVACAVARGVASCELPAGVFDLAFRIPGFVSRYHWSTTLKPHGVLDAGTLHFAPGSTLSGRVESSQRTGMRLDRVNVVVRPAAIPGANEALRHRNESARLTAHPTRRGSFAFDLPPGQFTIQASINDLISEEVKVDIAAGHEALLRQPLRLEPPRSVTVRVHPPLDPWSAPWKVELASIDPTGVLLSERSLKTSPDGSGRFSNVLPGQHRLTVVRAADQSWSSQLLDVDQDAAIDINVNVIRLTGTIRIGGKALAATVILHATDAGATAVLRSKADGTFAARLPAPEHDTWDEVEVRADLPSLKRTLQHVPIQAHDDGTGEMNVDLPSRSISGTVVDELGRPAAPALIDVILPDGSIQQLDTPDGAFTVTGLEAGRHRLRAATHDRESIDLQEVSLSDDDGATADVVVPVVPVGHLRGVVKALDGPVLGAVVYATRPGDGSRPIILTRVDQEGRFDIRFPAATPEVTVAINAPGFAFRLITTPLGADEQTFAVEQNGGTLSIDAPAIRSGLRPYLVHDGTFLPAAAAGYVAGASFAANRSERVQFQIPSIEPGAYSLCWLAEGRPAPVATAPCSSGVLAPQAILTLAE